MTACVSVVVTIRSHHLSVRLRKPALLCTETIVLRQWACSSESECRHSGKAVILTMFTMQPIGFVRSPYQNRNEVPRGLGAKHNAEGVLEILPEFEPGLMDIEGFSHLFVIWVFDRSEGYELLASPPSDTRQHGVFATRSPMRPNPIGLTVVELMRRKGPQLHVRGIDMLEGTPIVDIKPYLSSIAPELLRRGWLAEAEARNAK